jgi:general secretion pathway protein G
MTQRPPSSANGTRGFTLIELLIVVALIGILAALGIGAFRTALERSRQRATMADMRTLARALEAYWIDVGTLPDDSGGVESLETLLIPYQANVVPVRDAWRNLYDYRSDGIRYTLESFGKDGVDGADISVAERDDFNMDLVISDGRFVASPE